MLTWHTIHADHHRGGGRSHRRFAVLSLVLSGRVTKRGLLRACSKLLLKSRASHHFLIAFTGR
jgi:hypothetical protein